MDLLERLTAMVDYLKSSGRISKQRDIADAVGVSQGTISTALAGNKNALTLSLLRRIDDAYDNVFAPKWLTCGSGPMLLEDLCRERFGTDVTLDFSHHNASNHSSVVDAGGTELPLLKQEVEMLRVSNAELKAENERLRKQVDELHTAIISQFLNK